MEQNRPLNTTDGWEDIVNTNAKRKALVRDREDMRSRERMLYKMLLKSFAFAMASLALAILGFSEAMNPGLAVPTALVSLVITCVLFGRYLEAQKG